MRLLTYAIKQKITILIKITHKLKTDSPHKEMVAGLFAFAVKSNYFPIENITEK